MAPTSPISAQAKPQGCLIQSRSAPPPLHTTRSFAIAPITLKAHLPFILGAVGAGRAPSPIVNVPLAQGKERNAAAGAPRKNEDLIPDEDYVPSCPPSQNPNSQHPPAAAQIASGSTEVVDCAVASKWFW